MDRLRTVEELPNAGRLIGRGGAYERRYEQLLDEGLEIEQAYADLDEALVEAERAARRHRYSYVEASHVAYQARLRLYQIRLAHQRYTRRVWAFAEMMERPSGSYYRIEPSGRHFRH
jgi:hypothetical protein